MNVTSTRARNLPATLLLQSTPPFQHDVFCELCGGGGGGGGGGEKKTNMKVTLEHSRGPTGDGGVKLTHFEYQKTEGKLGDYMNKFMKWQNEKALYGGQGLLSDPMNPPAARPSLCHLGTSIQLVKIHTHFLSF